MSENLSVFRNSRRGQPGNLDRFKVNNSFEISIRMFNINMLGECDKFEFQVSEHILDLVCKFTQFLWDQWETTFLSWCWRDNPFVLNQPLNEKLNITILHPCECYQEITWTRSTQHNQERYTILSLQPNHRDSKSSRIKIHVTIPQKPSASSISPSSSSSSSSPPSSSQFQKTIGLPPPTYFGNSGYFWHLLQL